MTRTPTQAQQHRAARKLRRYVLHLAHQAVGRWLAGDTSDLPRLLRAIADAAMVTEEARAMVRKALGIEARSADPAALLSHFVTELRAAARLELTIAHAPIPQDLNEPSCPTIPTSTPQSATTALAAASARPTSEPPAR